MSETTHGGRDGPSDDHPATGQVDPLPGLPQVAVGVDLVERARIRDTYQRHGERFLTRVFTSTERAQARGDVERLAGRFAAKEACAKVLGTGIGQVSWQEIEIVRQPGGKPTIHLTGQAAARAEALGLRAFDVSIADTAGFVMAVVVAVG